MNDDTNTNSVHDVVAGSLERHGRAVGRPTGDLADVLRRVDRRRARRRGTAVIGSALAVAAGAAGIVLVAGPTDVPAPGDGEPAPASWGCTGFLSSDGIADYYAACEQFPGVVRPTTPVLPPVATSVVTLPAGTPTIPPTVAPGATTTTTTTSTVPVRDVEYVVVAGDSVYSIAEAFGVLPEDLAAFNRWPEGIDHPLQVDDPIAIPSAPAVASLPALPSATNPPSAALATTTTTTTTTLPGDAFRCTDPLGADQSYAYYLSCDTVPWTDVPPAVVVPTTVASTSPLVTTAPPVLPPSTTGPPVADQLDCGPPTTAVGEVSEREQTYTVVGGDSLSSIAALHGISLCILVNYNAWPEGIERMLLVGDTVRIPPNSRIP